MLQQGDRTPCVTLGLTLLVGPVDEYPVGLRLARDEDGRDLFLTELEGARGRSQGDPEDPEQQARVTRRGDPAGNGE